ncbi:putative calcium-binding protein CML17 [Panicum miliaceum]|uniref:Calcium-binding protein CML17 n=1 Tax=Panicum miliaceum TaxID=4540 RepID=A0A3L6Q692_PANMI|nr:putative calcium-binding protein CML17 [Panicum miliaceum]
MPPSSPLVKLPLLPRGLLSYIPTSILPSGRESAATTPTTSSPSKPQPAPPSPKKMSSSSVQQQQAGSRSGKQADQAELACVFELFDKNGDGRITREELEDSLGKLGMSVPGDELASMIARIDANGDGCVDVEEFGELYRAIMAGGGEGGAGAGEGEAAGEEADEDMREAFRVFDANGDGYITVDELGAVLSSLGLKQGRTAEECRRMIGRVDRDGDGRVDFHEFRQMMRAGGLATLG